VNIGKVPDDVAIDLDKGFHQVCVLLRAHGHEIIPKKMLFAGILINYLNPYFSLGKKEAREKAVAELVENIENFQARYKIEIKEKKLRKDANAT